MNKSWNSQKNAAAHAEGWCLSASHKGLHLERLDEAAVFEDDAAALSYVIEQAKAGSELHRLALLELGRITQPNSAMEGAA